MERGDPAGFLSTDTRQAVDLDSVPRKRSRAISAKAAPMRSQDAARPPGPAAPRGAGLPPAASPGGPAPAPGGRAGAQAAFAAAAPAWGAKPAAAPAAGPSFQGFQGFQPQAPFGAGAALPGAGAAFGQSFSAAAGAQPLAGGWGAPYTGAAPASAASLPQAAAGPAPAAAKAGAEAARAAAEEAAAAAVDRERERQARDPPVWAGRANCRVLWLCEQVAFGRAGGMPMVRTALRCQANTGCAGGRAGGRGSSGMARAGCEVRWVWVARQDAEAQQREAREQEQARSPSSRPCRSTPTLRCRLHPPPARGAASGASGEAQAACEEAAADFSARCHVRRASGRRQRRPRSMRRPRARRPRRGGSARRASALRQTRARARPWPRRTTRGSARRRRPPSARACSGSRRGGRRAGRRPSHVQCWDVRKALTGRLRKGAALAGWAW